MGDFFWTVIRGLVVSIIITFIGLLISKALTLYGIKCLLIPMLILFFYVVGRIW